MKGFSIYLNEIELKMITINSVIIKLKEYPSKGNSTVINKRPRAE